jgi:hypothetical protein
MSSTVVIDQGKLAPTRSNSTIIFFLPPAQQSNQKSKITIRKKEKRIKQQILPKSACPTDFWWFPFMQARSGEVANSNRRKKLQLLLELQLIRVGLYTNFI